MNARTPWSFGEVTDLASRLPSDEAANPAHAHAALEALLNRESAWPLTDPAPSAAEMSLVFAAAMRAPDHGQLTPWRFLTIAGDDRIALGELFVQAARLREPDTDGERFRHKAMAAPLLIALVVSPQLGHKVPLWEQQAAVAAATMNMLNALHLLGHGAFWASGLNARDAHVMRGLGLAAHESLLGFLYVGTPAQPSEPVARPDPARFVSAWSAPTSS